jgi:hypothetical protein
MMNSIKKYYILILVFLAVATAFAIVYSSDSTLLDVGESSLTIKGAGSTSFTIDYEDIQSVELVYSPDFGTSIDGGKKHNYAYGIWNNESWGDYRLYVNTNIDVCIVITEIKGVILFNYVNEQTTEDFYYSFLKYLEGNKN